MYNCDCLRKCTRSRDEGTDKAEDDTEEKDQADDDNEKTDQADDDIKMMIHVAFKTVMKFSGNSPFELWLERN